jgi:hypothetical protein
MNIYNKGVIEYIYKKMKDNSNIMYLISKINYENI